jgi:hypothetical protein
MQKFFTQIRRAMTLDTLLVFTALNLIAVSWVLCAVFYRAMHVSS